MLNNELVYREITFPFIGRRPVAFLVETGQLLIAPPVVKELVKEYRLTKKQSAELTSFILQKEKEFLASRLHKSEPCWKSFHNPKLNVNVTVYIDEYNEPYFSVHDIAKELKVSLKEAEVWCHYNGMNTLPYDEDDGDADNE